MAYFGIFGVKGAHGATTTRAIISVAVPLVLTFLLFAAALVAAALVAAFGLANEASF
jgi:hypothetical protein